MPCGTCTAIQPISSPLRAGRMGAPNDKPSQQALDSDFHVLRGELIRTFGESGPLPKRSSFRGMKRLDLRQVSL